MLRAVIFDVDGTIVDSNEFHVQAWDESFRRYGKAFPIEQLRAHIGKGGDQYLPNFLTAAEMREFGAELDEERARLYKHKYLPLVRPFPGVRDLFERIHLAGRRIALASSGKTQELDHYVALTHTGAFVDVQTTSDDVFHSKPHADVFMAALRHLRVGADEAVAVGDSPFDVIAAKRITLSTIGLLCGGFAEVDLRSAGAVAVFRDPANLLASYERSPLGG
jgi:HAD superfamily hydrolase (TIGR01549 family)